MDIPFHTVAGTVDLGAVGPEFFSAFSIADTLAKINRYNGRTPRPWSVASHSLLVEALCPFVDLKGWALLHDAHESVIGDITTPAVDYLCLVGGGQAVRTAINAAKGRLDRIIGTAWECPPRSHSLEIRRADWVALQAEYGVFFGRPADFLTAEDREDVQRACDLIPEIPASWVASRDAWIARAEELASMGLLKLPRSIAADAA
ncbi:hypothetical protein GCM10007291_48460 [Gemmobacter nanjingensis]|jgi:hypothetical protein|uniref:Uncharacterized protein n=1 Tax=Gemmobacter nanjingensis TaxID=488454 RepID=A0ABQ3FTI8_9RHOB|nr:hypothetical protein [Gemmobacter nanjingensis]GHC40887.1 hypothetical protein GCM10007291_48460 [Gemmobacter nanjingensis]